MCRRGTILSFLFFLSAGAVAQRAQRPFPQHVVYHAGSILPNHIPRQDLDDQTLKFYREWKPRYIRAVPGRDQSYVYFEEAGSSLQSVSEGQGYGMIIMALMADADSSAQNVFDSLYAYVLAHPSFPNSPLMAWSQLKNNLNKDTTSASDGDLDIAYALLLANDQWGSSGKYDYLASARQRIAAIMQYEINQDYFNVLLSDAVKSDSPDYFDTRSSDFMPAHFKAFLNATGDAQWKKAVDSNYRLFFLMQDNYSNEAGLLPDFIIHLNDRPRPAGPAYLESRYDGAYNYNACRVPWRIGTDYLLNGDSRAYDILKKINHWIRETTSGNPDNISAGYSLEGDDIGSRHFEALSFIAPFAVSAMTDRSNQRWLNALWDYLIRFKISDFDYYDNSIKMICLLILSGNYWSPKAYVRSQPS